MSKNVIGQLKQIEADANALFVKLHNYHWNIKGLQFYSVHEYTEKLYDMMSKVYDDTAERILQLGEKPILSMEEILKVTKIETEKGDSFDTKYVINAIIKDLKHMLKSWKKLSDTAGETGDKATVSMADDNIAALEKELWMVSQLFA